jgi:phage terminase small subunit
MDNQLDVIKLTVKQEKFVQGLFMGLTQREAYKSAYDAEKMMDKHIDEEACKLLANPKVSQRLAELTDKFTRKNIVTVEKVLEELANIGHADIKDYLTFKTEKTVVGKDEETSQPIVDYRQIVDVIDSNKVDGRVIQEISISKDGTFKFKLYNKLDALEKMGKYLGMFTDKTEVDNKVTIGFEQSLLDIIKRKNE